MPPTASAPPAGLSPQDAASVARAAAQGFANDPTAAGHATTAAINAAGGVAPSSQAMLVTSGAARSTTAANLAKLASLTAPPPQPGTQNSTPTGTGAQPTGAGSQPTPGASPQPPGTPSSQTSGTPTATANTNPSASSDTNPNTGGTGATPDPYDAAVASIGDPGQRAYFKSLLQGFDEQAAQAKANLDSVRTSIGNDPAADAAIQAIQGKYDQQIQLMQEKNRQVLGRAGASVAAFGGLGAMNENFLADEQQRAEERVLNLVSMEQQAMLKASAAAQTNDAKALNTAMTQYQNANKQKLSALNALVAASDKQVKDMQAQQRVDLQTQKQSLTSDIQKSTNLGPALAKSIQDLGMTDPNQIEAYVSTVASEYGISNPGFLLSAVTKGQQTQQKLDLSTANTRSLITKRNSSAGKPSSKQVKQQAQSTLDQYLNDPNAKLADGTPVYFNGKFTAKALNAIVEGPTATAAGYSRKSFMDKYADKVAQDATTKTDTSGNTTTTYKPSLNYNNP